MCAHKFSFFRPSLRGLFRETLSLCCWYFFCVLKLHIKCISPRFRNSFMSQLQLQFATPTIKRKCMSWQFFECENFTEISTINFHFWTLFGHESLTLSREGLQARNCWCGDEWNLLQHVHHQHFSDLFRSARISFCCPLPQGKFSKFLREIYRFSIH